MTAQATTLQASRLPIVPSVAQELGIDALQWRVLVEQVFPSAQSVEAIALALAYCKSRNLDVFKKPVHIVPMWSSTLGRMIETVWPGIAEVRTTAVRTGSYAGIDEVQYGPMIERTFEGTKEIWENRRHVRDEQVKITLHVPEYASTVVYRLVQGIKCGFHAKVYWEEAFAADRSGVPNTMWQKRPRGQLDKCGEAAALRKAFPEELGNTYVAEEMEGRTFEVSPNSTVGDPLGLGAGAAPVMTQARRAGSTPPKAPKPSTASNSGAGSQTLLDFIDPETVCQDAEARLGTSNDVEEVRSIFDSEFSHYQERLTPMDWRRLETILHKHVARAD